MAPDGVELPCGTLCRTLGVLFILRGFASDVTLATGAEALLWAMVFGASQQLVTFVVDNNKVKPVTLRRRRSGCEHRSVLISTDRQEQRERK